MSLPLKSAVLKGLLANKAVVAGAAALATVSTVGTAAVVSADRFVAASQPEQPQSAVVAMEDTSDTNAILSSAAPVEGLAAASQAVPTEAEDTTLPAQAIDEDEPEAAALTEETEAALPKATPAATGMETGNAEEAQGASPAADVEIPPTPQAPAVQAAASAGSAAPAPAAPASSAPAPAQQTQTPSHTTSIYDDSGLLRKEYYNEDNRLYEYSDVLDYNGESNSYTENIYRYDEELGQEILVRIDVYENGVLVSSITP